MRRCSDCGNETADTYSGVCRSCLPAHFDDADDGSEDDPDDWMDECGFVPGEGVCTLAGTEWCDWECPFNPCDPEGI